MKGENVSDAAVDVWILSLGWRDWILFGQIEEHLGKAGAADARADSIEWALKYCGDGTLEVGGYGPSGFTKWPETGSVLEARMRRRLEPDPSDPLESAMNVMFELTEAGMALIPEDLQY